MFVFFWVILGIVGWCSCVGVLDWLVCDFG